MNTEICTWGICLAPLNSVGYVKIFGFAEFLTALALLVVLFTIADVRFKFRTAIVPGDLYRTTFIVMIGVGLLTLMSEVWVAEKWYWPQVYWLSGVSWQAILGVIFFGTFGTWMYYAFIRPPVFYPRNAERFFQTLYFYVVKANDDDLKVLSHEIGRSAISLVREMRPAIDSSRVARFRRKQPSSREPTSRGYAHDTLMLIANRKLCRHIVQSSPVTVATFLEVANHEGGAWASIGKFATNISIEAFSNKESFVFQEAEEYDSGLIGHLKPVTQALYGRYELMEHLAVLGPFPFAIPYDDMNHWDGAHWEAYCRLGLLLFTDYLKVTGGRARSQALRTVFRNVSLENSFATYDGDNVYESSSYRRMTATIGFITNAIRLIDELGGPPDNPRQSKSYGHESVYDNLAHLMFEACVHAARIERKDFTSWHIQYSVVWARFFGFEDTTTWRIVRKRLRHLIATEICKVPSLPDYVNVPLLGYCANVMGLRSTTRATDLNKDWRGLHRLVLWLIRKHYSSLLSTHGRLAESMLVGKLSFDPFTFSVVKTYERHLSDVAETDSLAIDGAFRKTTVRRFKRKR